MIPGSANPLLLKSAAAAGGYQVSRSLRFNSSDSAYLSRTPAVAGNRRTWTWAGWIKRSAIAFSAEQHIWGVTGATDATYGEMFFGTGDTLRFGVGYNTVYGITTTRVFRDPGAWFHLVLAFDATQGTAANKIKLYINGVEETAFSSDSRSSLANQDWGYNNNVAHYIGRNPNGNIRQFNGYLADIHFIDGQALTPSSFTEVSATTGQLLPKAYSGSYGTNGFYLQFADNSSNTAATLGKDTSGTDLGNAITTPASNAPPTVDYLIVGGGGGAGGDLSGGGGGGGVLASSVSLTSSTSYAVAVGTGGAGNSSNTAGLNGGNSSFNAIIALGGGGGAGDTAVATTGGSGGGASTGGGNSAARTGAAGTSPQGYAGGNGFAYPGGPGGGGGAGQAGSNGGSANGTGGNGGNGVQSSITGTSTYYGGGGGGGGDSRLSGPAGTGGLGGGGNGAFGGNGSNGTANTGGGGGGGSQFGGDGGNGGSGVVIIRYANTYADLSIGSGLTYSFANSGGYKIYTFTASTAANNWSVNNFSVTAGSGNDSLVDTPTSFGTDTYVGGEVRGNYCTWNPLISTSGPIYNGNLEMVGANAWRNTKGTISVSTGKWYFEATYTGSQYGSALGNLVAGVGFCKSNITTPNVDVNDSSLYGSILAFSQTGHVNNFNAPSSARSQIASGDVIGFALNYDAGTYTIYVNNTSTSSGSLNFTGELTPWTNAYLSGAYFILNTGQRAFAYTAPSGFKALCDTNLPEGTITTSGTYTGNGVADGPFVYLNGVPTAMTVGGNAVTFGTHADKLSNGFKLRTTSTTYNQNALSYNYSITATGAKFKYARAQPNP